MRGQALPLVMLVLSCASAHRAPVPLAESAPAPSSAFTPVAVPTNAAAVQQGFELALVDDSGRLAPLEHSVEAPVGVSLVEEWLVTRDGETLRPRFVRLELQEGESLDRALQRIASWLGQAELPTGQRLAWGPLLETDANDQERLVGYRSYVLFPPSVVAKDVIEASVDDQVDFPAVRLRFSPTAAGHFQALTRDHRKERMAIVVRGLVQSAPIILSEISGGRVTVTIGGVTLEDMRARAEELVNALKGQQK